MTLPIHGWWSARLILPKCLELWCSWSVWFDSSIGPGGVGLVATVGSSQVLSSGPNKHIDNAVVANLVGEREQAQEVGVQHGKTLVSHLTNSTPAKELLGCMYVQGERMRKECTFTVNMMLHALRAILG